MMPAAGLTLVAASVAAAPAAAVAPVAAVEAAERPELKAELASPMRLVADGARLEMALPALERADWTRASVATELRASVRQSVSG